MLDPDAVLSSTDELEGVNPSEPDSSLYTRAETLVTFDDGRVADRLGLLLQCPFGAGRAH
mgnify:CR=1 FL=1